jgi:hypothetical protein
MIRAIPSRSTSLFWLALGTFAVTGSQLARRPSGGGADCRAVVFSFLPHRVN